MKTRTVHTLEALVNERLVALGATSIPTKARDLLDAEVEQACARVVQRTITAPRVGRAVARALGKSANTKANDGQMPLFPEVKA